jgi:hypothetical protein
MTGEALLHKILPEKPGESQAETIWNFQTYFSDDAI